MRVCDFLISLLLLPLTGFSQEEKDYQTDVTGFIKTDVFWDSRQTVDVRDGHFLLYPKNERLDSYGHDINSKSKFSILSIQTRLKGMVSGPGILGASAVGVIEGAFCGTINSTINSFRLRHAYAKLEWNESEMIIGQYWHPFFLTSNFPDVVSFNTGAPFQPLSRNPQIRFSHYLGDFRAVVTALSQIDFKDAGPNEKLEKVTSAAFLKNNALPEFNIRLEYEKENPRNGSAIFLAASANYKRLMPLTHIVYDVGKNPISKKLSSYVHGFSTLACMRYRTRKMTIKLEGIHGQLLYSMTMLGGYGIVNMDINAESDLQYAPINTSSVWTELHSNGERWQGGVFLGYTRNHGSGDGALMGTYSRGDNIQNVYRISPRLIHNAGQMRIATELECTVAAFGAADHSGRVHDAKEISNHRLLVGFYYFL